MDYRRNDNGLLTFLSHWGFFLAALSAFALYQVFNFFTQLSGTPWIWTYVLALGIATLGSALLFYSKLPLYRQAQFFTFGSNALPTKRRPFYRWGYWCISIAVALLLCLLLPHS